MKKNNTRAKRKSKSNVLEFPHATPAADGDIADELESIDFNNYMSNGGESGWIALPNGDTGGYQVVNPDGEIRWLVVPVHARQ